MLTRSPTAIASAPPEPPSPVTVTMTGTGRRAISRKIAGDGFALAAFFGVDPRISAGSIDKSENGTAKFRGQLHYAQRFAVAFGLRLAEIADDALLGVSSLLLADDGDRTTAKFSQAGNEGLVVTKIAVAMKFDEIRDHQTDPIQRMRALRMPAIWARCHGPR